MIVVSAPGGTSYDPSIADVRCRFVAYARARVEIIYEVRTYGEILRVTVVVVLFLVPPRWYGIVVVVRDRLMIYVGVSDLVANASVDAYGLAIFRCSRFEAHRFNRYRPVLLVGAKDRVRYFVLRIRLLVDVVGRGGPIFRQLRFGAYDSVGAIALHVYVHSALRVEGRERFHGVSVEIGGQCHEARAYRAVVGSFARAAIGSDFQVFVVGEDPVVQVRGLDIRFRFRPFDRF